MKATEQLGYRQSRSNQADKGNADGARGELGEAAFIHAFAL